MIHPVASRIKNKMTGVSQQAASALKDLASSDVGGGMRTDTSSITLNDNQFQLVKGGRVENGMLVRSFGSKLYIPTKPNSNAVLLFIAFAKNDGTDKLVRFDSGGKIYNSSTSAWTEITGTLTGVPTNYQALLVNDNVYFTDDGNDPIQLINFSTNTYAALGDAPAFKYIVAFDNRIFGFNLGGVSPNPVLSGWCGNGNYPEWNIVTDNTAGSQPLVDSDSGLDDFITGAVAFDNEIIVIRQRSIWVGIKTGISSAPVAFSTKVPGIGCDCKRSIVKLPGGIGFIDSRTRGVYVYGTDGSLTEISQNIRDSIISSVNDPSKVFGSFNAHDRVYSIAIPDSTSMIIRVWEYKFDSKTWTYTEKQGISTIADLDYTGSSITIDDLIGTIDALVGTIDSLSPSTTQVSRFFGYTTGELAVEDSTLDADWNTNINTQYISKDYEIPIYNSAFAELQIEYIPRTAGSFLIQLSMNGGLSWTPGWTVSFSNTDGGVKKLASLKKFLRGRLVSYQITSTAGLVTILNHRIRINQSGDSTK